MVTIELLKAKNCKVRIKHLRRACLMNGEVDDCSRRDIEKFGMFDGPQGIFAASVLPRGGKTIVEITEPGGRTVRAIAKCHPNDNYCKKEGVKVALSKVQVR